MRYCKSTIFQANHNRKQNNRVRQIVVCDTAKVRFFKQITTPRLRSTIAFVLFAILQKYDFSSKSQRRAAFTTRRTSCLRYCKSTIFQANHNQPQPYTSTTTVVCDTAKVRFFKQITTRGMHRIATRCCLRYCKSTIFQANHNSLQMLDTSKEVVCDTAKVRFFKQITTELIKTKANKGCLRYCKSTIFQANHNAMVVLVSALTVVCDTAKVRFFKQITTEMLMP